MLTAFTSIHCYISKDTSHLVILMWLVSHSSNFSQTTCISHTAENRQCWTLVGFCRWLWELWNSNSSSDRFHNWNGIQNKKLLCFLWCDVVYIQRKFKYLHCGHRFVLYIRAGWGTGYTPIARQYWNSIGTWNKSRHEIARNDNLNICLALLTDITTARLFIKLQLSSFMIIIGG